MRKYKIWTLGCKANQYDTQGIRELLAEYGWNETDNDGNAALFIINSCTVTARGESKTRQLLNHAFRLKGCNPESRVVLTGCLASIIETDPSKVEPVTLDCIKKADLVVPTNRKHAILKLLGISDEAQKDTWLSVTGHSNHKRAFVKIQEGCENFCSYCIVPYARGPLKSRDKAEIIAEISKLIDNGYREMVLTGIHIGAFGRDKADTKALESLIKDICGLSGILRLRLGSIEMNEISDEMLELAADSGPLCPHFHIPLQSGDTEVLRRMNRQYSTADFAAIIDKVRKKISLPAITTDVITGFPGETHEQHKNTVAFCRDIGFTRMHVFPYSPRRGTPAADFPGRIPPEQMAIRKQELADLNSILMYEYHKRFVGAKVRVVVERRDPKNPDRMKGHTERYVETTVLKTHDEWLNSEIQVLVKTANEKGIEGYPADNCF